MDAEAETQEKQMAAFVEKPEWQKLKEHLEARIKFHQSFLPNGTPIEDVSMEEISSRWVVANTIIQELQAIISTYEGIAESVRAKEQ